MELSKIRWTTSTWNAIPGFVGYAVSDIGAICRVAPGPSTFPGRLVKPQRDRNGYLCVMISRRKLRVHHAVLLAFVGPCPYGN